MAAATHDIQRTWALSQRDEYDEIEVAAGVKIYAGTAVATATSGYAGPLTLGTYVGFAGIAVEVCDNTGGAAGAKRVKVRRGRCFLPVGSTTRANFSQKVYASDDNTFTLTQGSNLAIGTIDSVNTAGMPLVRVDRLES